MYKHRAHLECQVSRASAKVKWFKNKMEIKPSKKYEIKSEDVYRKLTINDVDGGDEDTYTCDATDDKTSCKLLVEGNTMEDDDVISPSVYVNRYNILQQAIRLLINEALVWFLICKSNLLMIYFETY